MSKLGMANIITACYCLSKIITCKEKSMTMSPSYKKYMSPVTDQSDKITNKLSAYYICVYEIYDNTLQGNVSNSGHVL